MEVIDKWVAEFIILRQHNPRVPPANLLSTLKLDDSPDLVKIKISSVLRDISNSLILGIVDEGTLDQLEILEKLLLLQQHSPLLESHKSAYCWTAAECTLRFMWPLSASDGVFTDAIERIWTKRIGILKESSSDLVTNDLLKWEADMKKALEAPELYQRIRETNIRYTSISFLNQLLKEQWALLGSSSLESVAQRRFRKRKANNVEDNRRDPIAVDESSRRLESNSIVNANEWRGSDEVEYGNGNNRDVEGVGCLENDEVDEQYATDKELIIGAQEQGYKASLDKGDKTAARELKDYLLEIQRHLNLTTRKGQEHNNAIDHSVDVTPQPARVNRIGTRGQYHNEALQQDNVNEKGSGSQGTWSGRARPRPHLPCPLPLNITPLNKANVRRPKKFWTHEEVEALKEGVKKYGKSWKDIKNGNPTVFGERTEVDLKDKWRNLVR